MYRVDVYAVEDEKTKARSTHGPFYACLSAASNDGRLLTAGRKNATIVLPKDKSVSRDHVHLYLMSKNPDHQKELNNDDTTMAVAAAMKPNSAEETEACDQNPMGMALLVKNLGKFGTIVLALAPKEDNTSTTSSQAPVSKKPKNGSDTDGGSDTEDESQEMEIEAAVSQGKLPEAIAGVKLTGAIQQIHASLVQEQKSHRPLALKKLDAKESFAVPGNATTIILQTGQYGSTIILTRMDLQICRSGWGNSKKLVERMQTQLYGVGATLLDDDIEEMLFKAAAKTKRMDGSFYDKNVLPKNSPALPPTIYMAVPKRQSVPKQLIAWNLGFPSVTLEFLETLLKRKSPEDAWPNLAEFNPPSAVAAKDLDADFWDKQAPNPSTLWETCTFLSTSDKSKDNESIVRAAGGSVIQVYNRDESEAKKQIEAVLKNPAKKDGVFSITASGRSKIRTWIKDQGIPHLKQKDIVILLCRQEPLKDDKTDRVIAGKQLLEVETTTATEVEKPPSSKSEESEQKEKAPSSDEEKESGEKDSPKDVATKEKPIESASDKAETKDKDVENDKTDKPTSQTITEKKPDSKGKATQSSQTQTPGGTRRRRKYQPVESSDSDDSSDDDDIKKKPPPAKKSRTSNTDKSGGTTKEKEVLAEKTSKEADDKKDDKEEVSPPAEKTGESKASKNDKEEDKGPPPAKKARASANEDDKVDEEDPPPTKKVAASTGKDETDERAAKKAPSRANDDKDEKGERAKKSRSRSVDSKEKEDDNRRAKKARSDVADKPRERHSQSPGREDALPSVEEEDSMDISGSNLNDNVDSELSPGRGKKRREEPKKKKKEPRSYQAPITGGGSAKLEKTKDGWFIAAPSKNRKAYLRPKHELLDKLDEGLDLPAVAETVVMPLIVTPYDPARSSKQFSRKSKGEKDFKRFRKNSIIKGPRVSRIEMRAVLPKESDQQRALEEQQRAIDAQQRMADELFHGGGGRNTKATKTTTRRRRNV